MPNPGRTISNVQPPPSPANAGNERALSHGATSEQRLAPLRAEQQAALRRDYPELDDRRLALLADRLARVKSACAWLDEQRGVVRNAKGEPFPIVDRIDKWGNTAWQHLTDLERERLEPRPADAVLADHLERNYGGES